MDIISLYKAMEKMMLDKDRTKFLTSNAREMIETRYEENFVTRCLLDFYDKIIVNV